MNCDRLALLAGCCVWATALSCATILGIKDVPDAAVGTDDARSDAPDGSAMCDPLAAFEETPMVVAGLPADGVDNIRLSPDEMTAYIVQTSPNPNTPINVSVATRSSTTGAFGGATTIAADLNIWSVSTTDDNLSIAWAKYDSEWDGGPNLPASHIYWNKRSSTTQAFDFDAGTRIFGQDGGSELEPFVRADGAELYYATRNSTLDGIYVSTADAGFQNGSAVTSLPALANDPVVTQDGLVIYYLGNSNQLEVATRTSTTDAFGASQPVSLPDGGSDATNAAVLISEDRCTLYYETLTEAAASDGSVIVSTTLSVVRKTP